MTDEQTAPRLWFAGPSNRAQGIVAPLTDSVSPGAPGSGEATLEYQGDTDTLVLWLGIIGPDGMMQPARATAPIPAGLLFDLLIRRPMPAEGSPEEVPFASLAEHIEARTAEMHALADGLVSAAEVQA